MRPSRNADAIILVTRRAPKLNSSEDRITVAVVMWEAHGKGQTAYYLTTTPWQEPGDTAEPWSAPASELPGEPGGTADAVVLTVVFASVTVPQLSMPPPSALEPKKTLVLGATRLPVMTLLLTVTVAPPLKSALGGISMRGSEQAWLDQGERPPVARGPAGAPCCKRLVLRHLEAGDVVLGDGVGAAGGRGRDPVAGVDHAGGSRSRLVKGRAGCAGSLARLYVTPKTVETHVRHIFQKLGLPESALENKRVRPVLAYLGA
jgi:hypothetical protein